MRKLEFNHIPQFKIKKKVIKTDCDLLLEISWIFCINNFTVYICNGMKDFRVADLRVCCVCTNTLQNEEKKSRDENMPLKNDGNSIEIRLSFRRAFFWLAYAIRWYIFLYFKEIAGFFGFCCCFKRFLFLHTLQYFWGLPHDPNSGLIYTEQFSSLNINSKMKDNV